MAARSNRFAMDHPIVVTFLIFATIGFLLLTAEVLKPLALAILLSFALAPLVRLMENRGLPRTLAVGLAVVGSLVVLGLVIYVVQGQLTQLAQELPRYEKNILAKVDVVFNPKHESAIDKATAVAERVASTLEGPSVGEVVDVRVVDQPSFLQRLQTAVGPILEPLAVLSIVLILVLFILVSREDLTDRLIRLFGAGRVSATTRTMDEVGARISRYLAVFASYNAMFGLIVGVGLWAIGLPYAVLWGFLAATLRYIPYVGPASAFLLPLVFSVAHSPATDWREPLMVLALFGVLEAVSNSVLEPIIYGRTTGVSALGLMVAAMFWTWLWGPLGLLLSTPLTVCLAVLGKAVPGLSIFGVLLGEDPELSTDVRFYQRLLALDQDGAEAIVEEALQQRSRTEVCDEILIPVLSRAERDMARGEIDDRAQAFIWRVIDDLITDLEDSPTDQLSATAPLPKSQALATARVLGVATNDRSDALVLRMLGLSLAASDCRLEIVAEPGNPMKLAETIGDHDPELVVVSHLPPEGLTSARYLVRRVRARFADLPILVGRWGEQGRPEKSAERLVGVGATAVVFRLVEARDQILRRFAPEAFQAAGLPGGAPLPEPAQIPG